MAAAKTSTKNKTENEISAEIETDPWEEKVEIMIPRLSGKDQPDVNLTVNGRMFHIQRGKRVQVPRPIAEVLELKNMLTQAAEDYYYSNSNS